MGIDELRYLNSLNLFQDGNYKQLFEEGCSIPFLLINLFLEKFSGDNLSALRLSSIFSGILILSFSTFLVFKVYRIKNYLGILCLIYILNLFAIRPDIFFGVNEYTRDVFGGLILFIILQKTKLSRGHYLMIGILFGLAILTRKMATSYYLVFLFSGLLYILIFKKASLIFTVKSSSIFFLTLISCILTILIFNFYNLLNYGILSWENKELYGDINWAQYDYFNVIKNYKNELPRGHHSPISEAKNFLEKNGQNSLPTNFLEMIYFDWKITIFEFFIDYLVSLKYLTRLTGILYLLSIFYLIKSLLKKGTELNAKILFVLLFSIVYPIVISFVVISNIQPRWFMFFLPLTICSYFILINFSKQKNKLLFLTLNNLLLLIANILFIQQNFNVLL